MNDDYPRVEEDDWVIAVVRGAILGKDPVPLCGHAWTPERERELYEQTMRGER
jgi:hypothetical protein